MLEIKQEMKDLLVIAQNQVAIGDQIPITGILTHPDGSKMVLPLFELPKNLAKMAVHYIISHKNPARIVLIMESWMKVMQDGEEERRLMQNYKDGDLENDPDRQECLVVVGWQRGETKVNMMTSRIFRENGVISFGDATFSDRVESSFFPEPSAQAVYPTVAPSTDTIQ